MKDENNKPIPELILPTRAEDNEALQKIIEEFKKGAKKSDEKPLRVYLAQWSNIMDLLINALWFAAAYLLCKFMLEQSPRNINQQVQVIISMIFAALPFVLLLLNGKLHSNVVGQGAVVYLDNITKVLKVLTNGFNFLAWHSSRQPYVISFRKDAIKIEATCENKSPIVCKDINGLDVIFEILVLATYRPLAEALAKSLLYDKKSLERIVLAYVSSRIAALSALNSYDTMRMRKAEVAEYSAAIFGGEGNISAFEEQTGLSVSDPVLKDLGLKDESASIVEARAKSNMLREVLGDLTRANVKPEQAANIASNLVNGTGYSSTDSTQRYDLPELPDGLTTLALGGAEVAVGGKGGGKGGKS